MTANELADELQELDSKLHLRNLFKAATMLRQQAQEIEELKERLEETRQLYLKQLAITHSDTQSHPIEPVAMRYDFDGYGYMYIDSGSGSDWQTREKGEFLYTHPVRELTDEEIQELYHSEPRFDNLGNFQYLNFARIILKKAGEK